LSVLPVMARLLTVSLDEPFDHTSHAKGMRGLEPRPQEQLDAMSQLRKTQQCFVTQMLDTVLPQVNR
jgi:hypothetical protein